MSEMKTRPGSIIVRVGAIATALVAILLAFNTLGVPILASEFPSAGIPRVAQLEDSFTTTIKTQNIQTNINAAGLCGLYRNQVAEYEIIVERDPLDVDARVKLDEARKFRELFCNPQNE